jgi:hypothetical protein
MVRINFVAEDTLRDIVFRSVNGYSAMITRFCPDSVCGESNASFSICFLYWLRVVWVV